MKLRLCPDEKRFELVRRKNLGNFSENGFDRRNFGDVTGVPAPLDTLDASDNLRDNGGGFGLKNRDLCSSKASFESRTNEVGSFELADELELAELVRETETSNDLPCCSAAPLLSG